MSKDHDALLIQKFLEETLTEQELTLFKHKFDNDPDFAKSVKQHTDMEIALKTAKQFQRKRQSLAGEKVIKPGSWKKYWAVAASLTVIVAISAYFMLNRTSNTELAQEHFISERLYSLRSDETTAENTFDRARRAYQQGDKSLAIMLMNKTLEEFPDQAEYYFILGDMYFEALQLESAIYQYTRGQQIRDDDPYVNWNKAMAHLAGGDEKKAIILLKKIKDQGRFPHNQNAEKLLKKLQ